MAQLLGHLRQVLDHRRRVVGEPPCAPADGEDDRREHDGRARRARQTPALQRVDERRQRVAEHDAEKDGHQDRTGPVQRVDRGQHGEDDQREAAHIDGHVQQDARRRVRIGARDVQLFFCGQCLVGHVVDL